MEETAGKRTPRPTLPRMVSSVLAPSVQHRGDAQDAAAARRVRRQNFAAVSETWDGVWGYTAIPLSVSSVRVYSPSVIIYCPVIFFNHRSPRRSALALTVARRKDLVARAALAKHICDIHRWTKTFRREMRSVCVCTAVPEVRIPEQAKRRENSAEG